MAAVVDVIVVGAGPAGAIAAAELSRAGLSVVLLEAGPKGAPGEVPETDEKSWRYTSTATFAWPRVRAFGGRSLLWGGWSYRFPQHVFASDEWSLSARALSPHYAAVERLLGVRTGRIDARYRRAARELDLRIIPKRGAAVEGRPWTPHDLALKADFRAEHIALALEHENGVAAAVRIFDQRHGRWVVIRSRAFILAASAIESARLLLASELGPRSVGRGLVDHLIAGYILLEPFAAPSTAGRGPFPGAALVDRFVNVGSDSSRSYRGGFTIELDGPHPFSTLDRPLRASLGVPRRATAATSYTLIHAIGESFPTPKRYMTLTMASHDALGRAIPAIHLATTRDDRALAKDIARACVSVADAIAVPGSQLFPTHDALDPSAVGHEAGTCRMGSDAEAPCDPEGRVRGTTNVWVADSGALPTAGDRHPTLTVLAHARRVAIAVRDYLR